MIFEIDVDDEFINHFTTGGSSTALCNCGREHVAMLQFDEWEWDSNNIEKHELVDDLEKRAETDKNLVLDYENDSIQIMEIGSNTFVTDCPCEGWKPYMDFMVDNRQQIAEFLCHVSREIKRLQSYEEVYDVLATEYNVSRPFSASS